MSLEQELKSKVDAQATAFEEFKSFHKRELEAKGAASVELKQAMERANADITRLTDEIKGLQTAINRAATEGKGTDQELEAKAARSAALRKFFTKGEQAMTEAELKQMSVGTTTEGGYMVHPEFLDVVNAALVEISPFRQLANVQPISTSQLDISVDVGGTGAGWTTETGARTETAAPTFQKISIAAEEMYAKPQVTQMFLEDTAVNVEAYLGQKIAEAFAKLEGTAFISGTGAGQPKGILGYADGTAYNQVEQVVSGVAATIGTSPDKLFDVQAKLKDLYAANAKWLMHRTTVASLRKMKDSNGQYLWQPAVVAGMPEMFAGKALFTMADMPVEAAAALPIAYGDFKSAYTIVDRVQISILRDPYSAKPFVQFYARKRVGGGVVVSEAIKLLKCSV